MQLKWKLPTLIICITKCSGRSEVFVYLYCEVLPVHSPVRLEALRTEVHFVCEIHKTWSGTGWTWSRDITSVIKRYRCRFSIHVLLETTLRQRHLQISFMFMENGVAINTAGLRVLRVARRWYFSPGATGSFPR